MTEKLFKEKTCLFNNTTYFNSDEKQIFEVKSEMLATVLCRASINVKFNLILLPSLAPIYHAIT